MLWRIAEHKFYSRIMRRPSWILFPLYLSLSFKNLFLSLTFILKSLFLPSSVICLHTLLHSTSLTLLTLSAAFFPLSSPCYLPHSLSCLQIFFWLSVFFSPPYPSVWNLFLSPSFFLSFHLSSSVPCLLLLSRLYFSIFVLFFIFFLVSFQLLLFLSPF